MQKVVVFKEMSFWASQPDISELNRKIASLNNDGWTVTAIVPCTTLMGIVQSYTLLLDR